MKGRIHHRPTSFTMAKIYKVYGPIGQTQYRAGYDWSHDPVQVQQIYDSAMEMGFRKVMYYDYGDHAEWRIEAKDEAMEALFRLTWQDSIDVEQYNNDKAKKLPPDWITKLLYYTVKYGERNFPFFLLVITALAIGPIYISKWLDMPKLMWLTMVVNLAMTTLGLLRIYDDDRIRSHERKLSMSELDE